MHVSGEHGRRMHRREKQLATQYVGVSQRKQCIRDVLHEAPRPLHSGCPIPQSGYSGFNILFLPNPFPPSPEKVRPVTPRLSSMGMDTDRWFQSAVLSPVQMGPTVWVPVLDYMKKRSS